MPNYRMDIEYDGTELAGWQIQANARTVQEDLERALATILRQNIKVIGAGRTDAGVHASGQVGNFKTQEPIDVDKARYSLNALLAKDIAVNRMTPVSDDFHARYSAQYREYEYHIGLQRKAIGRQYQWHLCYDVDWSVIEWGLSLVEGVHDFAAFCSSGSSAKSKVCDVYSFCLAKKGKDIFFRIRANHFLYKMVRSLVGTLVDIGRGYLPKDNLATALETGERSLVGNTAPACGLTLVKVGY